MGILAIAVLLISGLLTGMALAQDDAPATEEPGKKITILDNIKAAGVMGVLIILLSVAGVSLIITFAMQIRRDVMVPPELLGHIEGLFEEEDYDAALEVVESRWRGCRKPQWQYRRWDRRRCHPPRHGPSPHGWGSS